MLRLRRKQTRLNIWRTLRSSVVLARGKTVRQSDGWIGRLGAVGLLTGSFRCALCSSRGRLLWRSFLHRRFLGWRCLLRRRLFDSALLCGGWCRLHRRTKTVEQVDEEITNFIKAARKELGIVQVN